MAEKIEIARFELANLEALINNTVEIKNVLEDLKDENKALAKDGKALDDTFIKNAASIKNLNKAYNANVKVLSEAEQKTADLAAREKLLVVALNQEVKSIDDARASNKLLNELRNSANATTAEGVEEIRKLNNALDANNAFIKDNVDAYTQQKIGIGGYKDAITEAIAELNPLNTSVQRGEGSFKKLTAGIKGAAKATLAFIATPIGAFITLLAGIGLIAKQFLDYNSSIREARILTEALTNTTGELADTIRNRAGAITEVFGGDLKENIEAARNLVKAFGVSYEEAFDKIEDGLIRGGSKNTEFLESLREYPKLFANAGFTAEEFAKVVNEGFDIGIFSDKLPDAIKEFGLAVSEQTVASRDALTNAFGSDFTNELFRNIEIGAITIKDALQQVSSESSKASLSIQQQAQLTADLFKGAGEDAGGALVIFEAVNNALSDEIVVLTELEKQIETQLRLQTELGTAKDEALKSDSIIALQAEFSNFSTWIETRFYQIIGGIGDIFFKVTDIGLAAGATLQRVFSKVLNFESFSLSEVADNFNAALEVLQRKRDAAIEIEKQKSQAIIDNKKAEDKAVEDLEAEAQRKKAVAAASAFEKQLQKEDEQLAKLHERVRAELERREEEDLKDIRDFDARKTELENELELSNAETQLEKDLLRIEQQNEKDLLELERITLTEQQKTDLLLLIEENREVAVSEIKKKYNDLNLKEQIKVDKSEIDQKRKSAAAVAQVQNALVGILTGLLGDSLGAKIAAIGIEAAIEAGAVGVKTSSSAAQNIAIATASGPIANGPLLLAANIQNATMAANSAAAIGSILSSAALKGIGTAVSGIKKFEEGGYVGGQRHSNGGTLIEAEKGEFVFSRKAVNMFGSLLPQMNEAAGGNSGLNTSGFFVDGGLVGRTATSSAGVNANDLTEIIIDSIGSIPVVNVADDTLSVANDSARIVQNASV